MVVFFQVTQFMHHHVINEVLWHLNELDIERDAACLCAASPSRFHHPQCQLRVFDAQVLYTRVAGVHPLTKDTFGLSPIPSIQQLFNTCFVMWIDDVDEETPACKFDHLDIIVLHFETILPPQVAMGLAADILAWR